LKTDAPSYYWVQDSVTWRKQVQASKYAHLMQTWEWGEYKACLGWTPRRMMIVQNQQERACVQILIKKLPMSRYSIGYIPRGPLIPLERPLWECMIEGLTELADEHKIIVIRTEPAYINSPENRNLLANFGFHQIMQTNQPRCTILVDVSYDEADMLKQMNRNCRRLIRKAESAGVTIETGGEAEVSTFYQHIADTAKRKHLSLQKPDFYLEAYRSFRQADHVELLVAKIGNDIVSSLMLFFYKNKSIHLWGGNSPQGIQSNASHLLHWSALRLAKKRGCIESDLWGIPDEIADMLEQGEDISRSPCEGLWGVYRFKAGFGGNIQCYVGTYDKVFRPALYRFIRLLTSGQTTMDRISSFLHCFRTR
jgi:peptidoglycan pentaglycine glycine transferase (the first glycine)